MKIHYASYGSNIDDRRFKPYVLGGSVPGTSIVEKGSSDPTPIDLDRSKLVRVPGLLYTAGKSQRWDQNGVAFVDLADENGHEIIMRSYPLTEQQFVDVVTQELDAPEPVHIDFDRVVEQGVVQVSPGAYGTVYHIGDLDREPILTFSAPFRAGDVVHNPPSPAYTGRIRDGLVNAGLDPHVAKEYVNATPGSKLGLVVPAHVTQNPGPGIKGPDVSAEVGPGPSRGNGTNRDRSGAAGLAKRSTSPRSSLPPQLAAIATSTPSARQLAERIAALDPGFRDGVLTNPGGGLTVQRRAQGQSRSSSRGQAL